MVKRLLIAYFIGNISAKKYQIPFMCIKVIASQRWDVFETRCRMWASAQHDGRPAEYRWRPLLNAAMFG